MFFLIPAAAAFAWTPAAIAAVASTGIAGGGGIASLIWFLVTRSQNEKKTQITSKIHSEQKEKIELLGTQLSFVNESLKKSAAELQDNNIKLEGKITELSYASQTLKKTAESLSLTVDQLAETSKHYEDALQKIKSLEVLLDEGQKKLATVQKDIVTLNYSLELQTQLVTGMTDKQEKLVDIIKIQGDTLRLLAPPTQTSRGARFFQPDEGKIKIEKASEPQQLAKH